MRARRAALICAIASGRSVGVVSQCGRAVIGAVVRAVRDTVDSFSQDSLLEGP